MQGGVHALRWMFWREKVLQQNVAICCGLKKEG